MKQHINTFLEAYTSTFKFSGSIAVREGNKTMTYSVGDAVIEHQVNNTEHTKFKIWSITKQFVAASMLKLIEATDLTLETKVADIFTEYKVDPRITIRQLLNHSSGIANYSDFENSHSTFQRLSHNQAELLKNFFERELDFEPGSSFNYSNSGYYIVGAMIERVSAKSLEDYVKESILDPLSLTDTGFDMNNKIISNYANGYYLNGENLIHCDYINMELMSASGGMYSTVLDLIKWDQALHSGEVLSEESLKEMLAPNNNYGLGLFIEDDIIDHSGSCEGFISLLRRNTTLDVSVVVLSNLGFTNNYKIATSIEKIINGDEVKVMKPNFQDINFDRFLGVYQDEEDKVEVIKKGEGYTLILDDKYHLDAKPINENTLHHLWIDESYSFDEENDVISLWGMEKSSD